MTWDLDRIYAEIDRCFQRALAARQALKRIPAHRYVGVWFPPEGAYRPTMFDIIAYEALDFYLATEWARKQPEDLFVLRADSPIFDQVETFLQWNPQTTDRDSPLYKAILLYQELLRFHRQARDRGAFLDADLWRLQFGYRYGVGDTKRQRYKAALQQFIENHKNHPTSARARVHLAKLLQEEGDWASAHQAALQGAQAFPKNTEGEVCKNFVEHLEAKYLSIQIEHVWNEPWPSIQVRYRNLQKLYFRVIRLDWDQWIWRGKGWPGSEYFTGGENWDASEWAALLATKPVLEWSVPLAGSPDYKERTEEVKPPTGLPPGFYLLVASDDPRFPPYLKEEEKFPHVMFMSTFWVSRLALVVRTHLPEEMIEGFVVEARSGQPIQGAEVQLWRRSSDESGRTFDGCCRWEPGPMGKTDAAGQFHIATPFREEYFLLVRYQDELLASGRSYVPWSKCPSREPCSRTVLFTDRSLYRPGQTIHYKGICLDADMHRVLPDRMVEVRFLDANHQEIASNKHQTNQYGSFSGTFTAPEGQLTGQMVLEAHWPGGAAAVRVEEYKRPKFQVSLAPPKIAPKLNEKIRLEGRAIAYMGAPIDGAKVQWRVERQRWFLPWNMKSCMFSAQFPYWKKHFRYGMSAISPFPNLLGLDEEDLFEEPWDWFFGPWSVPAVFSPLAEIGDAEIAHGETRTRPDGTFRIEFLAHPHPPVSEEDQLIFVYIVSADVTDSTGETRSAQQWVPAAYTALLASVSAPDWLTPEKPVELTIRTTDLEGQGQKAPCQLKLYRLQQPNQVQRPPLETHLFSWTRSEGFYLPSVWESISWEDPRDSDHFPLTQRVIQWPGMQTAYTFAFPQRVFQQLASWRPAELLAEETFWTDADGKAVRSFPLKPGVYRAALETQDRFGKKVTAVLPLVVFEPEKEQFPIKIPVFVAAPKWTLEPGEEFTALWATRYPEGQAFVEIQHGRELLQAFWTEPGRTQQIIRQKITEELRGGFTLRITQVRENRAYLFQRKVEVPWTNKNLTIRWEHFVSKLQPGQRETWSAVITGPDAQRAAAEMVATLYDQSLDAYWPHQWLTSFRDFFWYNDAIYSMTLENHTKDLNWWYGSWPRPGRWGVSYPYLYPYGLPLAGGWGMGGFAAGGCMAGSSAGEDEQNQEQAKLAEGFPTKRLPTPDLAKIIPRKNLNETAFFFPHLVSHKDGQVRIEFTMPEALTQWKFLGFAHDQELRSGFLQESVVTAKDLMVQPNPPRFLREGDVLEFTVKVTAHTETPLKIEKRLYTKQLTKKGPVQGPVQVGDELVTRIVIRVDRDMEYVHLKDYRGSGTEPVNVLSQYKYRDGLGYYESTRDTASHFFIDYLPKGTYVFEYSVRVQHRGRYQTGYASIQCMYAPEFNSHSESILLEVK